MSDISYSLLTDRLRSWAQNEEMIDQYFLEHGKDCNEAADEIEALRAKLANESSLLREAEERTQELERLARAAYDARRTSNIDDYLLRMIGGDDD
jgi:phage shock protein A